MIIFVVGSSAGTCCDSVDNTSFSTLVVDTWSTLCKASLNCPLYKGGLIALTPLSLVLGLWLSYGHWLLAHGLQLSSLGVGEEDHVGYASLLEIFSQLSYLELLFNPHFTETWLQHTLFGTTIKSFIVWKMCGLAMKKFQTFAILHLKPRC
jgi:hypothetical protein